MLRFALLAILLFVSAPALCQDDAVQSISLDCVDIARYPTHDEFQFTVSVDAPPSMMWYVEFRVYSDAGQFSWDSSALVGTDLLIFEDFTTWEPRATGEYPTYDIMALLYRWDGTGYIQEGVSWLNDVPVWEAY